MNRKVRSCPGCRHESCAGCGIFMKLNTNKHVPVKLPENFCPEAQTGFGLSFDLGTTALSGMLWDLEQGVCLGAGSMKNPQVKWGPDVISRLKTALQGKEELMQLQAAVVQALDQLAFQIMNKDFGQMVNLEKVVIVGNTAMCQLLMGISPGGLARAPFRPDYNETKCFKGNNLGFVFLKDTEIYVLRPIGGYVGADALALYSWICMQHSVMNKKILAVDIGTNGEILLLSPEGHYACSVAAGPALEGCGAACGMRAVSGAVDMVTVGGQFPLQDVICRVIDGAVPKGICGSGLLDALAVLYGVSVLDDTGYFRSREEAQSAGVPGRIASRIEESNKGRRILLTDKEHPVYLYAKDVRQLQVAIGAIRAGIEIMLEKANMQAEELDEIYLAGTFGSYIGIENSMELGLLPKVKKDKIIRAGNPAGTGAAMALLSFEFMNRTEKWAEVPVHVELAGDKRFEELFLRYMNPGTQSEESIF